MNSNTPAMSDYEAREWQRLKEHWQRRQNRRGVPNWFNTAIERTQEVAGNAANAIEDKLPGRVKDVRDSVMDRAARPALAAAAGVLELINDWALELNNPAVVEKLALKQGIQVESFTELRTQDLKNCDRLVTLNTLKWRTFGALEGGGMGALALIPIAGLPLSVTADVVATQVLSVAIASRIAYSYGYDAKDPSEQEFIQRLVRRSFIAQASKVKPLKDVANAAQAIKGRVRWSAKLRSNHRLIAAVERLLLQLGPQGGKVAVESVAKVIPFIGILIGAGMNATILGNVAMDAKRYSRTRFLCEKYGLPMPPALTIESDQELLIEGEPIT
jgi:hypothetical protein